MRRRLFNIAAVVSLLLCLAVGALWVRSLWHYELVEVEYTRWPRSDKMDSGFFQVSWHSSTVSFKLITEFVGPAHFRDASAAWFTRSPAENPPGMRWSKAGDETTRDMNGDPDGFYTRHYLWTPVLGVRRDTWMLGVRPWLPMALLAVMPALWVKRFRKARRAKGLGLCPSCGYDLRASPERCPECGAIAKAVSA